MLGISDLKRVLTMPGAWDLEYLKRFNGKDGSRVDYPALAREMGAAFTAFNASLRTGYESRFMVLTADPTVSYSAGGGNNRLPKISEHSKADPIVGASSGHMIPMYDFGGALGWTYWALRRSNMSKFSDDLRELIDQSRNAWIYEFYDRLFSKRVVTVAKQGKSLPFLDGGVADPDFSPGAVNGRSFTNQENHYRRYTPDAAGRTLYLAEAGEALRNHGFSGEFDLIVSGSDKKAWTSLDDPHAKFIRPGRNYTIITDGVEVRASVDESLYVGAIETDDSIFLLRPEGRVEGGYAHASKPGGLGSPKNPIAVRFEEGYPLGLSLVADIKHYPFEEAQAVFTFGDGVNNRANGFNGKFAANGAYTDAKIS